MLFELIATVAAGFAGAGAALLLHRLSARRLPRFIIPSAAGLAMFAYLIWSEYTWYQRTAEALPDSLVVFSRQTEQAVWRPWTYLSPVTERFAVVDRASTRRNEQVPGQMMVDIVLFARRAPVAKVPVLIDCVGHRRADIVDAMQFDAVGAVVGADWTPLAADDPLLGSACPET